MDEAVAMLELGAPLASLEGPASDIDAGGSETGDESRTHATPPESASPLENLANEEVPNSKTDEDQGSANIQVEPPTPTDDNQIADGGDASLDPVPIAPKHDEVGGRSKAGSVGDIPDEI